MEVDDFSDSEDILAGGRVDERFKLIAAVSSVTSYELMQIYLKERRSEEVITTLYVLFMIK